MRPIVLEFDPVQLAALVGVFLLGVGCRYLPEPWRSYVAGEDPPAGGEEIPHPAGATTGPRCTCPFGGLHDGLYADDPACPAHGNG
jgi:hypothetical protein